jgi:hypothetical protein
MRCEIEASALPRLFSRTQTQLILGDGCHFVSYPISGQRTDKFGVLCITRKAWAGMAGTAIRPAPDFEICCRRLSAVGEVALIRKQLTR